MRTTKALREIAVIAQSYDLEFDGYTAKGHFRWRHKRTGRKLVTVSCLTNYKVLRNTERDFRHFVAGNFPI